MINTTRANFLSGQYTTSNSERTGTPDLHLSDETYDLSAMAEDIQAIEDKDMLESKQAPVKEEFHENSLPSPKLNSTVYLPYYDFLSKSTETLDSVAPFMGEEAPRESFESSCSEQEAHKQFPKTPLNQVTQMHSDWSQFENKELKNKKKL